MKFFADRPRYARILRLLVAYGVLPNIPFLIAARFMHIERALIDFDYLAWGALSVWMPFPMALVGTLLLLVIDALEPFSGIYYLGVADAFSSFAELSHLSPVFAGTMAVLCLSVILAVALAVQRMGRTRHLVEASLALLTAIFVLVSLDALNGPSAITRRHTSVIAVNLVGSTGLRTAGHLYEFAQELRVPAEVQHVQSATASLLNADFAPPQQENIVLILEESLGLAVDPKLNNAVLAPLLNPSLGKRYIVETGTVPFHGPTVSGEFRELCGAGRGLRMRQTSAESLTGCLPARLRKQGYQVEAIHGFTSRMFGRDRWYPRLGFDRFLALEQLGSSLGQCGAAFRGICDDQIAGLIRQHLLAPANSPRFIYWLTLNSHLPIDGATASTDTLDCKSLPQLQHYADVCDLARVLHWTNEAIAKLAADPGLPRTRFIIVGDHAPPFISDSKRALYSQDHVPYIELMPRPSLSSPAAYARVSRGNLQGPAQN